MLSISTLDLVLFLTLALYLLYFSADMMLEYRHYLLSTMSTFFCLTALFFPRLRRNGWLWFGLAVFLWIFILKHWQFQDNHVYLWGYWILALACCLWQKQADTLIYKNARYLLGLTMLFASIQKARAINYMNGNFFYFTFLTDGRFSFIGNLFRKNFYQIVHKNNALLSKMHDSLSPVQLLGGSPDLLVVAKIVTWFTFLIELLLALSFLLPQQWRLARYRFYYFACFCGIYFLVPVKGFAAVLILMAMAQLNKHQWAFKLLFLVLLLYIFWLSSFMLRFIH